MTWDRVHQRSDVLEAVLARADARRDGSLPDLDQVLTPGVFESEDELLLALFARWRTTLLARLDAVIEREGGATCGSVAQEIGRMARQSPALSVIVAEHLDAPALVHAWRRCAELVGTATGLPMELELGDQLRCAVAGMGAVA